MTRRATAAFVIAVLGLSSIATPTFADDDRHDRNAPRERNDHRAPPSRPEPHAAPAPEQRRPDPRPAIGQRDQREHFEHRPSIPQPGRAETRPPIPQPPRAENHPAPSPRERIDSHPTFQQPPRAESHSAPQPRERVDNHPTFQHAPRIDRAAPSQPPARVDARPTFQAPRSDRPPTIQPRDRFDHRASVPATGSFPRHDRIDAGYAIDRHDRHWHERRFADREPHRWRGGHWVHTYRGGHMGWWWVIGPAWYLYPAPIYPYPDPDLEVVVYEDTVVPVDDACRVFNGDAIINDTGAPFYGTACLEPDGLWHIVGS